MGGALDAVSSVGEKASEANTYMQEKHPTLMKPVNDITNIVTVLPVGKSATVAKNTAKPAVGALKSAVIPGPESIVAKRAREIANIEDNYANTRKANDYSKDAGAASRERVAYTDVLADAVNENGLLRTKQPGGAVDQYRAQTIDKKEGVVRKLLEQEAGRVHLNDIEMEMIKKVHTSGLEGADLRTALNNIKREIAGYRLKADGNGTVPLTLVHDAKISTTKGINFMTEPNVATAKKSIANALKEVVENKSQVNVKEINTELAKYYQDIALLERLDGKRVKGGKLGKYTAQIAGNVAGGAVGGMIGGFPGVAVGTVVGGELAAKIKGTALSKTLGKKSGLEAPESPILKDAYERSRKGTQTPQYTAIAKTKAANGVIPPRVLPKAKPSTKAIHPEDQTFLSNFAFNPKPTADEIRVARETLQSYGYQVPANTKAFQDFLKTAMESFFSKTIK